MGDRCECGCGAAPNAGKRFVSGHNARLNGGPQGGLKHGHARGGREHPLYTTWRAMIQRCEQPSHQSFPQYGGRGIKVCERWRRSFPDFLADVGERPPGMTLDRWPNGDGDYEPGNVRWATRKEQQSHLRSARLVTARGKTQSLTAWAEETGISVYTLWSRLQRGESDEYAVSRPARKYSPRRVPAGRASTLRGGFPREPPTTP